jgi:hypothetical protein
MEARAIHGGRSGVRSAWVVLSSWPRSVTSGREDAMAVGVKDSCEVVDVECGRFFRESSNSARLRRRWSELHAANFE